MDNIVSNEVSNETVESENEKNHKYYIIRKIIIILFIIVIIIKAIRVKKSRKEVEENYDYFFCFTAMAKAENLYAKEAYEYYKQLGIDKFFLQIIIIIIQRNLKISSKKK